MIEEKEGVSQGENPEGAGGLEQAILDAAERLFLMKGFALTSTTEIAREAGCNQAMVHYYYRTKERLFNQLFRRKIALFTTPFFENLKVHMSFMDRMKFRIEKHFDLIQANPQIPFLLINELSIHPERLKDILQETDIPQRLLAQFEVELEAAIRSGEVRPIKPHDLLLNVISLNVFLFVALQVALRSGLISDEQRAEMVAHRRQEHVRMILESLKP